LQGLKNCYEEYHQIKIDDNAIISAIDLSNRYIPERFQPDKALDLIDEAAAKLKISNSKINSKIKKLKIIENQIKSLEKQKEKAILNENYHLAIKIRDKALELQKKLQTAKNIDIKPEYYPILTNRHIQQIIAQKFDLESSQISAWGHQNIDDISVRLAQKIIGQDQIINKVSQVIKRANAGLQNHKRPLASFIFAGSSGVGKTYLTEILSEELFAGKNNLIRLDMSEFTEQFNMSKLIGAPAGYVGYQEENKFTDQVKKKPHSIILFDEIEKAHKNIYNLFLQILDNGQITDASGQIINFRQTILIMTTNLGNIGDQKAIGFGDSTVQENEKNVQSEIKKYFSPEFLNRLDEIIVFNTLDLKNLEKIATIELDKLKNQLQSLRKELNISPQIPKYLANACSKTSINARTLIKLTEEKIIGPLSETLIKNPEKKQILIEIENEQINII